MPSTRPRTLSLMALLAAGFGIVSLLVVLPSIWIFLSEEGTGTAIVDRPFLVAGLLFTVPLFVLAPLTFAYAVRRGLRVALTIGFIWWSLIALLVLAATIPALDEIDSATLPVVLVTPATFVLVAVSALVYLGRLRRAGFGRELAGSLILDTPEAPGDEATKSSAQLSQATPPRRRSRRSARYKRRR